MTRPSRGSILMDVAQLFAERSTCNKPNGAVLSRDGRIIAVGYNGSPSGQPHCLEVGCLSGPDGGCTRTIHAEANVIVMAAKYGIPTEGATLHCTTSPCLSCAQMIVNAGIIKVAYHEGYRLPEGMELLMTAGIKVTTLDF